MFSNEHRFFLRENKSTKKKINVQLRGISSEKFRSYAYFFGRNGNKCTIKGYFFGKIPKLCNKEKKRKVNNIYISSSTARARTYTREIKFKKNQKEKLRQKKKPTKRKLLAGLYNFRGFTKKVKNSYLSAADKPQFDFYQD